MLEWKIEQVRLELRYTWKISRNQSDYKINSIISVRNGSYTGRGEVAPNIRYDETPEKTVTEFARFLEAKPAEIKDIHELTQLLNTLQLSNSLRFGIESAYIHYLCEADQTDIYTFLGIQKPMHVSTAYSMPIMEAGEMEKFYLENRLSRFKLIKVKVSEENAQELIGEVSRISSQPLIIDANESWKDPDRLLAFFGTLKPFHIALIEQPMPAGMNEAYQFLKSRSAYKLIADESICADADFEQLKKQFHGINMKLMKAGGYLNGIRLLNEAVKHGMVTMLGCMVETTLGISSAFHLSAGVEFVDLDGFLIIKDEPFGLVKEQNGLLSID